MKAKFQDQFKSLQNVITTNVSTLQSLVKQSENLACIIQDLKNTDGDAKIQAELQKINKNILASINSLSDQTENLFTAYNDLINNVFGKQ